MNRRTFLEVAGVGSLLVLAGCVPSLYKASPRNSKYNPGNRKGLALIVNHAEEPHHMENVFRSYNFFRWIGFNENDIKVISVPYANYEDADNIEKVAKGKKAKTGGDLTGIIHGVKYDYPSLKVPHIVGPPTVDNMFHILKNDACKLDADSEFFMYVTGHGHYDENKKKSSILVLDSSGDPNDLIACSPSSLEKGLGRMKTKGNAIIVDGCRTGGFSSLAGDKTTVITRTDEKTEKLCEAFAEGFFNSLRWKGIYDAYSGEYGLKDRDKVRLKNAFNRMRCYHKSRTQESFTGSIEGGFDPVLIDIDKCRFELPINIVHVMPPLPPMSNGMGVMRVPTNSCDLTGPRKKFKFGSLPDKTYMIRDHEEK